MRTNVFKCKWLNHTSELLVLCSFFHAAYNFFIIISFLQCLRNFFLSHSFRSFSSLYFHWCLISTDFFSFNAAYNFSFFYQIAISNAIECILLMRMLISISTDLITDFVLYFHISIFHFLIRVLTQNQIL